MIPVPYRVQKIRKDLSDTFTLQIQPESGRKPFVFEPGQFNMLYVFGVGEIPISISGDPRSPLLSYVTQPAKSELLPAPCAH